MPQFEIYDNNLKKWGNIMTMFTREVKSPTISNVICSVCKYVIWKMTSNVQSKEVHRLGTDTASWGKDVCVAISINGILYWNNNYIIYIICF